MLLIHKNQEDQDFSSVPTMPSACPAHPHDGNQDATQGSPTEAELQENFKVHRGDPSHWHIKGERVRHREPFRSTSAGAGEPQPVASHSLKQGQSPYHMTVLGGSILSDDVPWLKLVVAFSILVYTLHTYLDIRQLKVS